MFKFSSLEFKRNLHISKSIYKTIQRKIHIDFDPSKDYYKILGVDKSADEKQIKAAYYKLAKELHPDRNQGKTTEKFKEINNAYDTLSDRSKRSQYDSLRSTYSFGGFQRTNTSNQYNQYRGGAYQQQDPFRGFEEFYNRMKNEFKKTSTANNSESTSNSGNNKKEYYSENKKKEFYKNYFNKNKKYYKKAHYTKTENEESFSKNFQESFHNNSMNYYTFFLFFSFAFFIYIVVHSNNQRQRNLNPPVGQRNPSPFSPPSEPGYQASTLYTNTRPNQYNPTSEEYSNNRYR